MSGALIIVFREVLEAGLIVGIVLAATRGLRGRALFIGLGLAGGLLGAAVVAGFASVIADAFEGSGQELLNAAILLTAVVTLAWHNAWMARHGRELAAELSAVGHAVRRGERSLAALALVVGLAVLREGSEVVLFLYGIVAAGTSVGSLLAGGLLGVAAGVAVSAASYAGLATIPPHRLFAVTTGLITLIAAGLAADAMAFLSAAGVVTVLDRTAWNTAWLLPQDSLAGRVLHTLVGYIDRPTQLQVLAYGAVIAAMVALVRIVRTPARPAVARAPA